MRHNIFTTREAYAFIKIIWKITIPAFLWFQRVAFMNNPDKILLIGIVASFLLVNIFNTPVLFAEIVNMTGITAAPVQEIYDNRTSEAFYEIAKPVEAQVSDIPYEYSPKEMVVASYTTSTTRNGMSLETGSLKNNGNETIFANVTAFGKSLEARIGPNQTWAFSKIKNSVITSDSSDLVIDSGSINYYEMNNWLIIGFSGDCTDSDVIVYTDSAPMRLSTTVDANWKYEYDKRMLIISLKSCSRHEITVDWNLYPRDRKTIYVEDFREYEELVYGLTEIQKSLNTAMDEVRKLNSTLSLLEADSKSLIIQINETVESKNRIAFDIDNSRKDIEEINQTREEMQRKITENTILTPLQSLLVATIMLALLLYVALFGLESFAGKKTVEKNENKQ